MHIGLVLIVFMLADSFVLGRSECSEVFTEPGNISNKDSPLSEPPLGPSDAPPTDIYCEFYIRAPENSFVEFNFTRGRGDSGGGGGVLGHNDVGDPRSAVSPPHKSPSSEAKSPSAHSSSPGLPVGSSPDSPPDFGSDPALTSAASSPSSVNDKASSVVGGSQSSSDRGLSARPRDAFDEDEVSRGRHHHHRQQQHQQDQPSPADSFGTGKPSPSELSSVSSKASYSSPLSPGVSSSEQPSGEGHTQQDCLPKLMVVEVTAGGREHILRSLCIPQNVDSITPQVFQSQTPLIKLNYSRRYGQAASFELSFVFQKWPSLCEHKCDDGSCLPDGALICDYVKDCVDESDETNCVSERDVKIGSSHFLEVLAIVVVVVFTIGVALCVFFHYRLTSRLWRNRQQAGGGTEHRQLTPHAPPPHQHHTEVVYVPTTPLDRLEREVALQRERQQRHQAIQMDMELNLPPAIHISEDGEEGYAQSQRLLLQLSCQQRAGEAIRPPPNKTVLPPGDSPPPFRSNSVGKIEGSAYNYRRPTVSVHGNSVATVPNQYHGNNNHHNHHHHPQHHQSFPPALLPTSTKPQPQVYVGGTGAGGSPFIPRCHSVCSGDKRPVVMVAPPSVSVSQVQHNTTGRQANTSAVSDTLNTTTAAAVQQPGAPVSATTACCEPANSPSPSPPTGNT